MGRMNIDHRSFPIAPESRRQFLGRSILASSVVALGAPALLRGAAVNEKLNIAIIGVGGRGGANLNGVRSENIVALCDVYEPPVSKAAQAYPQAKKYSDFRRLFDDAKDFDAVVVSTCEQTHAFAVLPALQLGKHVYCEKPLTHDVGEAGVVIEEARLTHLAYAPEIAGAMLRRQQAEAIIAALKRRMFKRSSCDGSKQPRELSANCSQSRRTRPGAATSRFTRSRRRLSRADQFSCFRRMHIRSVSSRYAPRPPRKHTCAAAFAQRFSRVRARIE